MTRDERELRTIQLDALPFSTAAEDVPDTDAGFERLVAYVRSLYMMQYRILTGKWDYGVEPIPNWDGGEDRFGRNHNPTWPKVARQLIALSADPALYMSAQFKHADARRPPLPNQLFGEAALARYKQSASNAVESARQQLGYEQLSVDSLAILLVRGPKWEQRRAMRYALFNHDVVWASPLLRYCLAVLHGLPDVAARYYEQALVQYAFQYEVYDAAWAGIIPLNLPEEGSRLRARVAG